MPDIYDLNRKVNRLFEKIKRLEMRSQGTRGVGKRLSYRWMNDPDLLQPVSFPAIVNDTDTTISSRLGVYVVGWDTGKGCFKVSLTPTDASATNVVGITIAPFTDKIQGMVQVAGTALVKNAGVSFNLGDSVYIERTSGKAINQSSSGTFVGTALTSGSGEVMVKLGGGGGDYVHKVGKITGVSGAAAPWTYTVKPQVMNIAGGFQNSSSDTVSVKNLIEIDGFDQPMQLPIDGYINYWGLTGSGGATTFYWCESYHFSVSGFSIVFFTACCTYY